MDTVTAFVQRREESASSVASVATTETGRTLAATAYTDLATRYPTNPHDAWWELGEIYERRLRDDERARAAYAQVPAGSKRYQDAQRKLTRR